MAVPLAGVPVVAGCKANQGAPLLLHFPVISQQATPRENEKRGASTLNPRWVPPWSDRRLTWPGVGTSATLLLDIKLFPTLIAI